MTGVRYSDIATAPAEWVCFPMLSYAMPFTRAASIPTAADRPTNAMPPVKRTPPARSVLAGSPLLEPVAPPRVRTRARRGILRVCLFEVLADRLGEAPQLRAPRRVLHDDDARAVGAQDVPRAGEGGGERGAEEGQDEEAGVSAVRDGLLRLHVDVEAERDLGASVSVVSGARWTAGGLLTRLPMTAPRLKIIQK